MKAPMRFLLQKILMAGISLGIMAAIFWKIQPAKIHLYFASINPWLMTVALLLFVPQIVLFSYRWVYMVRHVAPMSLWQSTRLSFICSSLNFILPSKLGDFSRVYFMNREQGLDLKRGMNIALFEKYLDLSSLAFVAAVGALADSSTKMVFRMIPFSFFAVMVIVSVILLMQNSIKIQPQSQTGASWMKAIVSLVADARLYLADVKRHKGQLVSLFCQSVFIWFVQIFQLYLIFVAFHARIPLVQVFCLMPIAILAGLLPFSVAGVGTRDSALIYLFSPFEAAGRLAGIGIFISIRYLLPALLGIAFLYHSFIKPEDLEAIYRRARQKS